MVGDFDRLEQAIARSFWLGGAAVLVLLAVAAGCAWLALGFAGSLRDAAQHTPVLVVPGAVGGVYTPGIAEEAIRGAARYLAGLATSFSGVHGFDLRFDELESYASPRYLAQLQAARRALRHEVETQNQARTFIATPGAEVMTQVEPGLFDYVARGERAVFASGLPLDTWHSTVHLRLRAEAPSASNRTGVVIEAFDVRDEPRPIAAASPGSARP
ncbi:MAG TPA: hypothetical protein VMU33_10365 [Burkholderiaceae bacterium]|nr:hypothetical protein [Burkholderiaceae bacterium]